MTAAAAESRQSASLVPGELRGYRQFELRTDGLYPLAKTTFGPWDGRGEQARCAKGVDHASPSADCGCGLYGWYLPGSATVALGPASAVIAARGRCILGDRGFRAEHARIEAVALPAPVRWNPRAAARARRMLAEQYPHTQVYRSARAMLRDHPPHDVRSLGIQPPPDRSRGYRAAVVGMFALALLLVIALAALPRLSSEYGAGAWWVVIVILTLAWQGGMVWLVGRLLALQGHAGPRVPRARTVSQGSASVAPAARPPSVAARDPRSSWTS